MILIAEWTPETITALVVAVLAVVLKPMFDLIKGQMKPANGNGSNGANEISSRLVTLEANYKTLEERMSSQSDRFREHEQDGSNKYLEVFERLGRIEERLKTLHGLFQKFMEK